MSRWPSPAPLLCPLALGTRQRKALPSVHIYCNTPHTYESVHIITNFDTQTDNYTRPKEYICTLILKGVQKRTISARWLIDICLQWCGMQLSLMAFIHPQPGSGINES